MPNIKPVTVLQHRLRLVHSVHIGPTRTLPKHPGEIRKLPVIADRVHLHAAIVKIARVALYAEPMRGVLNEIAVPDSLHTSVDHVPAR